MSNSRKIREFCKCKSDPFYFYNKGFKTIGYGGSSTKVNDWQKQILFTCHKHETVAINQPRNIGASYALAFFITWHLIFGKEKDIVVYTTKALSGVEFLNRVRRILYHSEFFDIELQTKNAKSEIRYNGSRLKACSHTDQLRGFGIDMLIVDDATNVKKLDLLCQIITQIVLMRGGKTIMSGTPGGKSTEAFEKWYLERKKLSFLSKRSLMVEKAGNRLYNESAKTLLFSTD